MIKKFIEKLTKNFDLALAEKTNWGRNDIKLMIQKVISDSLAEMME